MIVLGLTGSMGMGKTTAAMMLRDMGASVHCSDEAVHELLGGGGKAVYPVSQRFPGAYDKKNDCIDRRKLRDILGFDHDNFNALEKILHPLVIESQQKFLREQQAKRQKIVVLDIPLLFETGSETRVDYTICVSASRDIQEQRVMSRDGMTKDIFEFFLSRQLSDIEKKNRADFVVQTGNGLADTRKNLQKIIKKLKGKNFTNKGISVNA